MTINIQENIPLAPMTTFHIGGPAKFFVEVKTKEGMSEAISWAKENKEKVFIFGGGSNILINDKGVPGLVVKMANSECEVKGERIDCGAGALLARAVILASGNNLSGLEWAIGIPGTVGGAVVGNAGAYGSSMSDLAEAVEIYNIKKDKFITYGKNDCKFNYRESIFKSDSNLLVWRVVLKLNNSEAVGIKKTMDNYLNSRKSHLPSLPSAGSVFKNASIKELAKAKPELAVEAEEEGVVKNGYIGAGWLIDYLGLRGKIIGGAKISLEHANFIVNTGKATAEDVITLISYIKQQVRDKLEVQLKEEIQYLGF